MFRIRNILVIYYNVNSTVTAPKEVPMYSPGLRLRQTREALGLTYRDVEKASYQIAVNRAVQTSSSTSAAWQTSRIVV